MIAFSAIFLFFFDNPKSEPAALTTPIPNPIGPANAEVDSVAIAVPTPTPAAVPNADHFNESSAFF